MKATYVGEYFRTANYASKCYNIHHDLMNVVGPAAAQTAPGLLDLF